MKTCDLIIESLCPLSLGELNGFDKFLQSPYFRKKHFNNSKVYELFKMLKLYLLRFPSPKQYNEPINGNEPVKGSTTSTSSQSCKPIFNWEKAAKKLFPADKSPKVKNRMLIKICSQLISYLLEFFAFEKFHTQEVDFRLAISEELFRRKLSQTFRRYWNVKYFSGIYSEAEGANIFHRYQLIRLANLYKEKYKESYPDYDIEEMLINKYGNKMLSDFREHARMTGYKVVVV